MTAKRTKWALVLTAFFAHLPGLKLFFGVGLSPFVARINMIAVALTLAAMGGAALAGYGALGVAMAWIIGHFVWGLVLAQRAFPGHFKRGEAIP